MHIIPNKNMKIANIGIVLTLTLLTTGCEIEDKIQKEIDEQQALNKTNKEKNDSKSELEEQIENNKFDEKKGNHEDNYVMTEEQKELLKKAKSQTAQEAATNNTLDKKVVLSKKVPQPKEVFTDREEAAQYLSYILFLFHSSQIDGETFYYKIEPYMHPRFIEILPTTNKRREEMFHSVQKLFRTQLESTISNYEMTEVAYDERIKEGFFYRKYTLKNGKEIFYKTTIGLGKKDEWLLIDDEPSVGYEAENSQVPTFKQKFIEIKEKKQ